jgi:hypothetical protein
MKIGLNATYLLLFPNDVIQVSYFRGRVTLAADLQKILGCEGIGYLCPRTGQSREGHGSPKATCVPGRNEVAKDTEVQKRSLAPKQW